MDSYSYFFIRLFSVFFFFYVKMQKKIRSNCSIIGCDLSKKHKLTLYKTQNGEANLVTISSSLIFTRSYLPVQNLGDKHPNTTEWAS